jgi:hypothetical protein
VQWGVESGFAWGWAAVAFAADVTAAERSEKSDAEDGNDLTHLGSFPSKFEGRDRWFRPADLPGIPPSSGFFIDLATTASSPLSVIAGIVRPPPMPPTLLNSPSFPRFIRPDFPFRLVFWAESSLQVREGRYTPTLHSVIRARYPDKNASTYVIALEVFMTKKLDSMTTWSVDGV